MVFPKSLTTITPLSKIFAAVLFIILPFVGFFLGMEYEKPMVPVELLPVETGLRPVSTPVINETAGWKAYRNEEIGFSFRYPDSMFIRFDEDGKDKLLDLSTSSDFVLSEFALQITVSHGNIMQIPANNLDGSQDELLDEALQLNTLRETLPDIHGEFLGDPPWGYYYIFTPFPNLPKPVSGVIFTIRIHDADYPGYGGTNTHKKIANQILSSFRFVEGERVPVPTE